MPTQQSETTVTETTTETPNVPVTPGEHPQKTYTTKKRIFRAYQAIWYILGVVEVLLAFRVGLKALGANSGSGFTDLIYTLSNPLALPFRGIFQTDVVEGSVFEWSTIVAGLVYTIIAWGLVKLFQLIKPTNPQEVERTVNSQ